MLISFSRVSLLFLSKPDALKQFPSKRNKSKHSQKRNCKLESTKLLLINEMLTKEFWAEFNVLRSLLSTIKQSDLANIFLFFSLKVACFLSTLGKNVFYESFTFFFLLLQAEGEFRSPFSRNEPFSSR